MVLIYGILGLAAFALVLFVLFKLRLLLLFGGLGSCVIGLTLTLGYAIQEGFSQRDPGPEWLFSLILGGMLCAFVGAILWLLGIIWESDEEFMAR